ncbi:MAG: hypothetical protein HQ582_05225 [Planctomycetes bacterium]|nr:hypothetical protein [Planctomycetota bacterium]
MDLWAINVPPTLAIAAVATLGYLVGRRGLKNRDELVAQSDRGLRHAQAVTREMEKISRSLRRSVIQPRADLGQKRAWAGQLNTRWQETTDVALDRPKPGSVSWLPVDTTGACLIRQDSNHLVTVADAHAASLTGTLGRGGSDDAAVTQFAMPEAGWEEAWGTTSRLSSSVEETAPVM